MKSVGEVAKLAGVSVRTLRLYDEMGLLKPSLRKENGYRFYSESDLAGLQSILLFRELDFSLKEIQTFLNNPAFDEKKALLGQIEVLKKEKQRLEKLIAFAEHLTKGEKADFAAFDRSEMEQYKNEVKARWGNTKEYEECSRKYPQKPEIDGLIAEFAKFGKMRDLMPDSDEVQAQVKALQGYISSHFYTCSKEVFRCLGQMYVGDERFNKNIDSYGGDGTAVFVATAIEFYCK